MPPWPPSATCAEYTESRALTAEEKQKVLAWIDDGMPEGSAAEYSAPAGGPPGLSRVDRTVQMPGAYTPQKLPDDYRCFVVDWPETTTKFVSGFRARPGNAALVHHVIAYLATPDQVARFEKLDADEPGLGYTCFGGPGGGQAPWIAGWAPGNPGSDFPSGTGIRVEPGSKIVLQVHYNAGHSADHGGGGHGATALAPDLTAMDFKLDDKVEREALIQPWADLRWVNERTMHIPAGAADVVHRFAFDPTLVMDRLSRGTIPSGTPFTIWSANLHMHTYGRSARLAIARADKSETCLLDIPKWDFHWQGSYGFSEPKTFRPGDQLVVECHFDNSGSTIDRNWGEGTDDEMCLGGVYITR